MGRTIRAIIGVLFVLAIAFSAISICQNIGRSLKVDVTEQGLYTLSAGTKSILSKLNQPIKVRLYYAKTASLKGPDQIRYFNNYYEFVKSLLEEYEAEADGMVEFEVIDPRPFSDEEVQALRYGLRRFSITEEESFFFGLVIQTQFGVEKVLPFFSPDRQRFVEYDISYLIDSAITRQKSRVGVLSSLPVMGDDVTGYMAQMMQMQGQRPRPAWTFIEQLRNQYEVRTIGTDVEEVNDVDILLVIHPKELPEKTLFAIDQYILNGGRAVICVDPYCFVEQSRGQPGAPTSKNSDLNLLLQSWGLEMPANTFAGDRSLALRAPMSPNQRPEKIIGFLSLTSQCFNTDSAITAELNQVRMLFGGILKEIEVSEEEKAESKVELTPLVMTTEKGNSWSISSPYELMAPEPSRLMSKFVDGFEPVAMGYLVTGRLKSSFPDGMEVEIQASETEGDESEEEGSEEQEPETMIVTGLTEAVEDCAVVVFADVDFISDTIAYQNSFFGTLVVGDNGALMQNAIEELSGSSDLISIRSRGSFKRPFLMVDEIERQAEAETAEEEAKINAEIAGFQGELSKILASAKEGEEEIIGSSIVRKKKEIEFNIRRAQRQLREVKMQRREQIEALGNMLRNFNMLMAPVAILGVAIVLWVHHTLRKRHYISHASDS
ncbi:MAG: GldG family protein [Sedimentisphaerales bacterium]|nr:GldG family protein [Sedimentisphaerales bacterium]